jgi:NADH:ubiquinone oxidoreductase subunit D
MEFYERVSGARMHAAFHRPANIYSTEIDNLFLQDILFFVKNCFTTLNEMHNVLTYNKIWKQRIVNIGVITQELCENFNLTGVMSRSAGVKKDLRLSNTQVYSGYNNVSFKSYFGVNGDCFDRYLIRMLEMGESLHIVNSVIKSLHSSNKSLNTVTSDL